MTAQPLVVRDDLSRDQSTLSKSALVSFDMCPTQSWFDLHDPRPLIPQERITFGSALDAAIEQALTALRSEQAADLRRSLAAATEVIQRDEVAVDLDEIERATEAFLLAVAPRYDFRYCSLQHSIRLEDFEGLGPARAHPDVILADSAIWDVKSSSKSKPQDAAATSVELGMYVLLREAEKGEPVHETGYWTWVRTQRPGWQIVSAPVTDEMRRRTRAVALAYTRAKRADEVLNRRAETPVNWSMTSGPKGLGLCASCAYSPANSGPCQIAVREGEQVDIADAA